MCGIFGFAAEASLAPSAQRLVMDLMAELAVASEVRGRDASGFALLSANGELLWYRQPGPASDLFRSGLFRNVGRRRITLAIGHTRLATHGAPAVNGNNHPHLVGDWAVVHNGVIPDHERKAELLGIRLHGQCDSELLAHLLARHGSKGGPRECLALCGSQSVLAINRRERVFLAWSNGLSALVAFRVEGLPARWWASTAEIAAQAAARLGLALRPVAAKRPCAPSATSPSAAADRRSR